MKRVFRLKLKTHHLYTLHFLRNVMHYLMTSLKPPTIVKSLVLCQAHVGKNEYPKHQSSDNVGAGAKVDGGFQLGRQLGNLC